MGRVFTGEIQVGGCNRVRVVFQWELMSWHHCSSGLTVYSEMWNPHILGLKTAIWVRTTEDESGREEEKQEKGETHTWSLENTHWSGHLHATQSAIQTDWAYIPLWSFEKTIFKKSTFFHPSKITFSFLLQVSEAFYKFSSFLKYFVILWRTREWNTSTWSLNCNNNAMLDRKYLLQLRIHCLVSEFPC